MTWSPGCSLSLACVTLLSASAPASEPAGLADLSQVELEARLEVIRVTVGSREQEVRRDVEKRLHRIAYEKYREIEALLGGETAVLVEMKRREAKLGRRILIAEQMREVQVHVGAVQQMLGLLRLYAQR